MMKNSKKKKKNRQKLIKKIANIKRNNISKRIKSNEIQIQNMLSVVNQLKVDGRIDTAKVLTIDELEQVNQKSIDNGYNRNVEFSSYKKVLVKGMRADKSITFLSTRCNCIYLVPTLIHNHKGFKRCEQHIRCWVVTESVPECSYVLLDVPMSDWLKMRVFKNVHYFKVGNSDDFDKSKNVA